MLRKLFVNDDKQNVLREHIIWLIQNNIVFLTICSSLLAQHLHGQCNTYLINVLNIVLKFVFQGISINLMNLACYPLVSYSSLYSFRLNNTLDSLWARATYTKFNASINTYVLYLGFVRS